MRLQTLYPSIVPSSVLQIISTLQQAKYEAVIVGGAVRDILLRRETNDWDVASNATPDIFQKLFPRCHPTGLQHGTVTIVEDNLPVEVTTFRGEGTYSDGRRPDDVRFGVTLTEDLARRDLSINALAWDPFSNTLFDPFGGKEDLHNRLVRAVGDAEQRFLEDGLRPMRAIRIASLLGFSVEAKTLSAIPNAIKTFRKVSVERIRDELLKTLGAPRPSSGLTLLRQTGLLKEFLPEIEKHAGEKHSLQKIQDSWCRTLQTVDATIGEKIWRLAALLHNLGIPIQATYLEVEKTLQEDAVLASRPANTSLTEKIGRRLRLSSSEIEILITLVAHGRFGYSSQMSGADLRRFIRKVGIPFLPGLFALRRGEILAEGKQVPERIARLSGLEQKVERILLEKAPLFTQDLAISGNDLIQAGVPRGPQIGKILNFLLEKVLEDPSQNTRERLLALLPEIQKQIK